MYLPDYFFFEKFGRYIVYLYICTVLSNPKPRGCKEEVGLLLYGKAFTRLILDTLKLRKLRNY